MRLFLQIVWMVAVLLAASPPRIRAQSPNPEGLTPFVPLRPSTRGDLARREALELYAIGLLQQHDDRLLEATRTFEEALHLDPEAAPLYKALIPLYVALFRSDEALAACQKALDLDPGDYETWSSYARQLKHLARLKEARNALARALACSGLAEHVDLRVQLYYDLGALCEEMQDNDQAVAAFIELVRILDNPQTPLELGTINPADLAEEAASIDERIIHLCIEAHQYDRALRIFAGAKGKHPELARRLNYNLAKIYFARAQPDKALAHLDGYLQTQPQGAEAYQLRSDILRQLGRNEQIVPALERYAARDSFNVALHLLLAREYAAAGQNPSAEKVYQTLADQSPTAEIFGGLFSLYRAQGEMDKAVYLLDDALSKADPSGTRSPGDAQAAARARAMLTALQDDPKLIEALLPAALRALVARRQLHQPMRYFLAVLAARAHQLHEAELFYRQCLNGSRRNPQRETAAYRGLIEVLWAARKYGDVVTVCQQGLNQAQSANHLLFRHYLSRALVSLGRVDEALAEADREVDIADNDTRLDTRLDRISILTQAERYPQAIAEAQALAKEFSKPEQVRAIRLSLHNIYTAMREFAKAEEQLRQILQADPNDATANNNLGYLWADQGKNLPEAERLIRKALELDREQKSIGSVVNIEGEGDNAAFVDSLGWVLFREGRLEEACTWLKKATELSQGEEDPTVWDHLGDVYLRLQKTEEARQAWEKSLQLYDAEKTRKTDANYLELKRKLDLLKSEAHPR
jgi:tetratricopeptide (TPR) repeat protein